MPSAPRRYAGGITNVGSDKPWGMAPMPYPQLMSIDMEDFYVWLDDGKTWVSTSTQNNSIAASAGSFGLMRMATSKCDDSVVQIQRGGTSGVALVAGKRAFFGCRWSTTEATQNDFLIGLCTIDTSVIASAPTNGVYFGKDDGDTNIDFLIRAGATAVGTDAAVATLAADTMIMLEWYFDGVRTFYAYSNGALVSTVATADFPTGQMVMTAAITSGQQLISLMTLDFLYVAIER